MVDISYVKDQYLEPLNSVQTNEPLFKNKFTIELFSYLYIYIYIYIYINGI